MARSDEPAGRTKAPDHERRSADVALARRCVDGDRRAEAELFHAHIDRVHAVVYRLLGRGSDTEDAAQDTMLRLFRSLSRFRGESTLATWVERIAVRVAIDHLHARRRRAAQPLDDQPEPQAPEAHRSDLMDREEVARRLYAALEGIDPSRRVAFVLHVVEGRSMAEIAEMMGATRVATKSRVWRARRELEKRARKDTLLGAILAETGGEP